MIIRELVTRLGFNVDAASVKKYDGVLDQMRTSADRTADQIRRALNGAAVITAAAIAAAIPALTAVARSGDEMTSNMQKLEGALGSVERAKQIYDQLYQVIRVTGASIGETVTAFGSYNLAMAKNNRTAEETVRLIGGLQASMSSLGLSTQQVSSVTMQLGQALGKGVLNGDELVSLREAMPQLVDELRQALNLTDEQFSKAAENGELTAQKLIGPLLDYADKARKRLAGLATTMSRGGAGLRNTWQQVQADLDKVLGLSEWVGRQFEALSNWLERMRLGIPTLAKFLDSIGGVRAVMEIAAYSIGVGTAALAAFNAALLVTITRSVLAWAAVAAPYVLAAAAITGIGVLMQDFAKWMKGNTAGTLFGLWFGDFATVGKRIQAGISGFINSITSAIAAEWEKMGPQLDELTRILGAMAKPLMDMWRPVGDFFKDLWAGVVSTFEGAWRMVKPIIDGISGFVGKFTGAGSGALQPGEERPARRGGLNRSGLLDGFPTPQEMSLRPPGAELLGRMGSAANTNNSTVNVSQTVNVTATSNNPAAVASAAERGAGLALQDVREIVRQEVGAFGRVMRVAIPSTE